VCHVVVPRQRADRDPVAVLANAAKAVHAPEIDEQRRPREPQPHSRKQGMPAGKELRVFASEQLDRVLDGLRHLVLERSRDHVLASWIALHTRSGDAGICTSATPRGASASTTAFITAAGDAIAPVSPTPLTPSGFVGLGVSVRSSSNEGSSAELG